MSEAQRRVYLLEKVNTKTGWWWVLKTETGTVVKYFNTYFMSTKDLAIKECHFWLTEIHEHFDQISELRVRNSKTGDWGETRTYPSSSGAQRTKA